MNTPPRWLVAVGAGLLLTLTALAPASTATAAAQAPASASAKPDRADRVEVPARALVERAINPDDYECEEPVLQQYVNSVIASMTLEQLLFVIAHQNTLLTVPTYEALIYGSDTDPTYALTSHGDQLTKSFRQVKSFWSDVRSDDIELHAMHGDVLLDADRIARTLAFLAETDITAEIQQEADTVAAFMQSHGDFIDNPLWTLNAYAYSNVDDPDPRAQAIPDKLVFGDGFLQAMDDLGLGDVAPRVVMGHEFGHHIQYELDLFETELEGPEATRRTELMADAYASYFGAHKLGLTLNKKRIVDSILTFYAVGDCQFDNDGHHGTPNQRQRAAEWGVDLAQASQPASSKLLAAELAELFEVKLPELVAPDA